MYFDVIFEETSTINNLIYLIYLLRININPDLHIQRQDSFDFLVRGIGNCFSFPSDFSTRGVYAQCRCIVHNVVHIMQSRL